ncbi:alpha/beta hydrolase [Peribacillus frigoritolerans]|uniref:alpha/beta hydrolase n=1 Tax=Peribacillus frigoritolerans TaxID=450367 RepID=UPI00204001E6|nr:alpha/beta hydrolase [Peribacillus frigoritolerans]MCM3170096.1 alpha/beta hydrolase [Peribacillus frigoritolerans]
MKKSVKFKNGYLKMAGNLYLPEGFDESKKYSGIVVIHPGGGVKEQTAGTYAQKLSDNGIVALAFDASHQGESDGEPRLLEDPNARVEDVRCAVDYLTTLPYIDQEKIGALGICAGGGYAVAAASTERRIKAVATVSAVDIGAMFRGEGSIETQLQTLEAVAKQRTAEANGTDAHFLTYAPDTLEEIDENTPVLMREAFDYYRTPRAQHPNSPNRFLFTSVDKLMAFSASSQISTYLTQPMLLIVGTEADTRGYSKQFHESSNGPKELFWVEGATHIAMYDIPEYVDQAVTKLTEFFGKNL